MWCHMTSSDAMWSHVMSFELVISSDLMWCHVSLWCHVVCDVMWPHVMSHDLMWCHVSLRCHVDSVMSCGLVMSWSQDESYETSCIFLVKKNWYVWIWKYYINDVICDYTRNGNIVSAGYTELSTSSVTQVSLHELYYHFILGLKSKSVSRANPGINTRIQIRMIYWFYDCLRDITWSVIPSSSFLSAKCCTLTLHLPSSSTTFISCRQTQSLLSSMADKQSGWEVWPHVRAGKEDCRLVH